MHSLRDLIARPFRACYGEPSEHGGLNRNRNHNTGFPVEVVVSRIVTETTYLSAMALIQRQLWQRRDGNHGIQVKFFS